MLGKLSVPGRFTNLDESRARPNIAYSRCKWGLFEPFFSRDGPIRLKYCLKWSLNPNQPTNQTSFQFAKLNFRFVRGGRSARLSWVNLQVRGVLQFGCQ